MGQSAFRPTNVLLIGLLLTVCGCREIRIKAIRLGDSANMAVAPITRNEVKDWVDRANLVWEDEANIRFLFDASNDSNDFVTWYLPGLNYVPNTPEQNAAYNTWGDGISKLFYPESLVVYFRARGGQGWSGGPPGDYVSMPSWTNTNYNPTLLSHELGHFFGLAHTFNPIPKFMNVLFCSVVWPWNYDGDAHGQNGGDTTDDIDDTPADVNNPCLPKNSQCGQDPVQINGFDWTIPWQNVMSYHDCYPEHFSPIQVKVIRLTLEHPLRKALIQP